MFSQRLINTTINITSIKSMDIKTVEYNSARQKCSYNQASNKVPFWQLIISLLGSVALSVVNAEPVLNIFNWADYIGDTTIEDFEEEFGINVNYDIYESSELVDAKMMAGKSGYDLVVHSAAFSSRFLERRYLRQAGLV